MLSVRVIQHAAIAIAAMYGVTPCWSEERSRWLENLVRQDCGSCHGMTLKGGLGPDLLAARLAGIPSDALVDIILDGVPGTPMPPWRGLLSEQDAIWIAKYLKTESAE